MHLVFANYYYFGKLNNQLHVLLCHLYYPHILHTTFSHDASGKIAYQRQTLTAHYFKKPELVLYHITPSCLLYLNLNLHLNLICSKRLGACDVYMFQTAQIAREKKQKEEKKYTPGKICKNL